MNQKRTLGFLFDLDGVIIDSETEYSKIWRHINETFPTGIDNLEQKIKGTTLSDILSKYFPDESVRESVTALLYEKEKQIKYVYKDGAREFLVKLKSTNYPTALVTSSNDDKMANLKEQVPDLLSFFDIVVTANDITKSKPDPEGYLKGAERINVPIEKCVVFEDSLQGVAAGNNAGAFVVGVAGTHTPEELATDSHLIIHTLEGLRINDLIKNFDE